MEALGRIFSQFEAGETVQGNSYPVTFQLLAHLAKEGAGHLLDAMSSPANSVFERVATLIQRNSDSYRIRALLIQIVANQVQADPSSTVVTAALRSNLVMQTITFARRVDTINNWPAALEKDLLPFWVTIFSKRAKRNKGDIVNALENNFIVAFGTAIIRFPPSLPPSALGAK